MKIYTYSRFTEIVQKTIILLSFVVTATFYPALAQTTVTCDNLVDWASSGNVSEINTAIADDENLDIDCQGHNGYTPLNRAAKDGHLEVVEVLLSASADTEIADTIKGRTPLFWASAKLKTDVVDTLLDSYPLPNPNHADFKGNVALDIMGIRNDPAQLSHSASIFILLIKRGANINDFNPRSRTVYSYAARDGDIDLVSALIAANGNLEMPYGASPTFLLYAAKRKDVRLAIRVINGGGLPNSTNSLGQTPLIVAARNGSKEIVEALIFPNYGHAERLKLNAKDNNGETALVSAIKAEPPNVEVAEFLIGTDGIDIEATSSIGDTPLLIATKKNNVNYVEKILRVNRINRNATDSNGDTALIIAAKNGRLGIIKMLVNRYGIDIGHRNKVGKSALDYALALQTSKREEVALALLLADTSNGVYYTLKYAQTQRNNNLVLATTLIKQILSQNPPAVNVSLTHNNMNHKTMLHYAAYVGNNSLAIALVRDRALETTENDNGDTPLYIAIRGGYTSIENNVLRSTILPAYDKTMRWALMENDNKLRDGLEAGAGVNIGYQGHNSIFLWVVDGENDLSVDDAAILITVLRADGGIDDEKNSLGNIAYHSAIVKKLDKKIENAFGKPEALKTLRWALENGDNDLRDELHENQNVNARYGIGSILLHFSARRIAKVGAIKALIADNAELDTIAVGSFEWTALTWRAAYATSPNNSAFRALIEAGADKSLIGGGYYNISPLMIISNYTKNDLARLLLSRAGGTDKALVNAEFNGSTALHYAVNNNTTYFEPTDEMQKEMVKLLIAEGANVSHENNSGNTALVLAANNGRPKVVEELFRAEKGSNALSSISFCHHQNNLGHSALDYANSKRSSSAAHQKVYELINQHCPSAPRMGRSPASGDDAGEPAELQIDLPTLPILTQ